MAVNEEILLDIKVQNADALTNIAKLTAANNELKSSAKALAKDYKDGAISQDDFAKQSALISAQIKENTAGIRENSKEIKTNAASVASASDSINGMRARVADLNVAWNSMSAAAREGDAGKAIQKEMASLNDSVNVANKSVNNFKDNVGNYPSVVSSFGLANTKAGKSLESLGITASSSFSSIGKTIGSTLSTIGTSLKALMANPIILFITVLVAAGMLLYDLLKNFSPIINPIKDAFAALSAVMSTLKTIFLQVVTGTKSFSEALDGTGEAIKRASEQAREYNKLQREIGKETNIDAVRQAKYKNQIDELILQSKNRTLTEKQRSDAIQKALDVEKVAHKEKMDISAKEVKAAELKIAKDYALTEEELKMLHTKGIEYAYLLKKKKAIDKEDIEGLRDKLVAQQNVEGESIMLRGKAQNRQDQLDQKADAAAAKAEEKAQAAREKRLAQIQKAHDDEIKKAENLLTLKKTNQKDLDAALLTNPKYFKERLTMLEQNSKDEQAINALKYKKNSDELKIANANSDKELASGKLALQKSLADQSIKALDYELQLSKIQNETLLAGQKLTNEQLHKNRIADIQSTNKEELAKLKIQLDAKILTESEYLDAVQLKNAEKNLKIAQDNADFEASERDRKIQAQSDDYANELSLLQENSDRAVEIKKAQLDAQMQIEISDAQKRGSSVVLVEQKYALLKKKIDKDVNDAKLDQAKRITDGIMNLFGKTTKAGKAAASASVAIDTYKGAQAAITGMAGAGPVGWALGAIEAGVIIAGGAKSISDIWAVNENAAASVSSTASTAASSATQNPGTTYTNLPTIASMYGSNASQNETAQIIAQSAPAPVVSVTEITNMQNTVQVKENSKL